MGILNTTAYSPLDKKRVSVVTGYTASENSPGPNPRSAPEVLHQVNSLITELFQFLPEKYYSFTENSFALC